MSTIARYKKSYLISVLMLATPSFLFCSGLPHSGSAKPISIEGAALADSIVGGWNAISSVYLEHKLTHLHPGDLIEAPVFQDLIIKYAKNARVILDAATGNGWFTFSLLKWNILNQLTRIVGIDISQAMIATAQAQCSNHRVEFFCGSLDGDVYEKIGISEKSIDLIISSNALDCVENIEQTLSRLYSVLKPGCCAVISIRHPLRNAYYLTGSKDGDFQEGVYAERWNGTGEHEVIRFYRKEASWDMLFKKHGFEIVEKNIPVVAESVAKTHPEQYQHYKNKKHPGVLIYVLRRPE